MTAIAPWFPLLGPLLLLGAALCPTPLVGPDARARGALSLAAGLGALLVAVLCALVVTTGGAFGTGTRGLAGIGVGVLFDALTAVLACLVAFVGAVVLGYSRNYLAGDPGQPRFFRLLCATLAAVQTMIVSGNLALLAAAWVATSVGLHHLLLFYPERPGAQRAAWKKFVASRLGDAALLLALLLMWLTFRTLDLASILAAASAMPEIDMVPWTAHPIAGLLAIAALLKSAQFPAHGWLPEVMETPTPVSALLHAGIINAGGFLVLRLADVMTLSTPALDLLAIVGGFTALFGSMVMLTQSSVKVSLAWSTVAQMGFMLLQCGLGAFSAAVLHIVAHSMYKAHAFLSSGSVIDLARAAWTPGRESARGPRRLVAAVLMSAAIALFTGIAVGERAPAVLALGAILAMGLAHLLAASMDPPFDPSVFARGVVRAVGVAGIYFLLQLGSASLLASALPSADETLGAERLAIIALVLVSFAAVTLLQSLLPILNGTETGRRLWVHLHQGLYVNIWIDRVLSRIRPRAGQGGRA